MIGKNLEKNSNNLSKNVLIFGSGRWARVYIEILVSLKDVKKIYVYTKNNNNYLSRWIKKNSYSSRIKIFKNFNKINFSKVDACIVVNSPENHFKYSKISIENNIPVLIEKPISTSLKELVGLNKIFKRKKSFISVSQVFNYTDYLSESKKLLKKIPLIHEVSIKWHDPEIENRYGEVKKSSSISSVLDFMPHILSILESLFGKNLSLDKVISYQNNSTKTKFTFVLNGIKTRISLHKSAKKRNRIFKFFGKNKRFELDFSEDKAFLKLSSKNKIEKNTFPILEGSLKKMIIDFLKFDDEDISYLRSFENHKIIFSLLNTGQN